MLMLEQSIWKQLEEHQKQISLTPIKNLFSEDSQRFDFFSLEGAGLFLDYSKNRITPQAFNDLCKLAEAKD